MMQILIIGFTLGAVMEMAGVGLIGTLSVIFFAGVISYLWDKLVERFRKN